MSQKVKNLLDPSLMFRITIYSYAQGMQFYYQVFYIRACFLIAFILAAMDNRGI